MDRPAEGVIEVRSSAASYSTATYEVTKTFGHERGLSVCFRQHGADSHCRYLHGYALSVAVTLRCWNLDARNWVVDFGGFKELEAQIKKLYDHKTLVAADDPEIDLLRQLHERGILDMRVVSRVSCEAFAAHIFDVTNAWLNLWKTKVEITLQEHLREVRVVRAEVSEHPANRAVYSVV